MLLGFIDFVKHIDPDIVTAWNLERYDGPYIVNRMRNLRIDYSELSPINRVDMAYDNSEIRTVRGREFIDMIPAFKKIYFSELESYSLNNVGANLLGKEKVTFDTSISQLWRDNPQKLIEYNIRDVEIMVDLDEQFRIWDLMKTIQDVVGINLSDILHNTRITQAYFMRKTDRKMPRSTYDEEEGQKYSGGYVLESTPGISKNIAVLDIASQYPSSMISYNMSPEKKVEGPEATDAPTVTVGNGVTFEYDEIGFVPRILLELIDLRDEYKKKRDQYDPDDIEYRQHDLTQYALKVIANSIYGALGHQTFVLYDKDIASSTTYVGRETVKWAVRQSKELGYEPIYGDTDSIMISVGNVDEETGVERAEKLATHINESYDDYADQKNIDLSRFDGVDRQHMFELEAEKLYSRFFMQRDTKKKYAAKIVWKEGKWVDDYDWAQYGKKSDMAKLSRDVQRKFLKMVLNETDESELQEYITDVCNKIKDEEYDLDYIGIPGRIKKEFHEYKTDRPILRGAKYTNEYLDEEFGKGSKPKYVYVKRTPPGLPDTDVVAFSQLDLPDGFIVDYDKMVRKTVQMKLKRIIAVIDMEWEELYRQSASLLDY